MVDKAKSKSKKSATKAATAGKSVTSAKSATAGESATSPSAHKTLRPGVRPRRSKRSKEPAPPRIISGFQIVSSATLSNVRISPQKARLLIDLVRGKQVEPALQILTLTPKKAARMLEKLLRSAIANAVDRYSADVDKLWVAAGWVDSGKTLRRLMPRAQGRGDIISKRSSHMTVQVGERVGR